MSKHLISIMLDELKVVRVICRKNNCGAISEVRLDKLESKDLLCPACHEVFKTSDGDDLNTLAKVMRRLIEDKKREIEFVIPAKD